MAGSFEEGGNGKPSLGLFQVCHSRRSWLRTWSVSGSKTMESRLTPSAASFAAASARSLPVMLERLGVHPTWAIRIQPEWGSAVVALRMSWRGGGQV